MTGHAEIIEYEETYPTLNLSLKNLNEKCYDLGILLLLVKDCGKGFKVKKLGKTNHKGTKVKYEVIKNEEDFERYKKEILETKIKEFNNKYKESLLL